MKIGVIFGSQSTEHEVSIASAFGLMQGIIKNTSHEVYPIYITKSGQWVYEKDFLNINNLKELINKDYSKYKFNIDFTSIGKFKASQKIGVLFGSTSILELDVIFPILHGKNGEDGSVQGTCQLLDVPYISTSVLGSAIGMNKIAMKDILKANNIPVVNYVTYFQGEENIEEIEKLGYPIFVKPANLGSSIGISRVTNKQELIQAVEVAYHYDSQIICEKGVNNLIELNCSILPHKDTIITSSIERVNTKANFLSFEEKYINEGGTMQGIQSKVEIPAKIPQNISEKIYELCKLTAQSLQIDGGAPRIDFLWEENTENIYVNEINTIPGAMQLHLRTASGMEVNEFIEKLVSTAIFRHQISKSKSINFSSNVIDITVNFRK